MITNILTRIKDIEILRKGGTVWPQFVDFHCCDICNQHCVGCAYNGLHSRQAMTEENHMKAINTFLDVGVKAFDFAGGGEPTLLPYLADHMRYLTGQGAFFGLLTNGTMLHHGFMAPIVHGAAYCRISLEASCLEDYVSYKREAHSVWYQVMDNVRALVKLRNKVNSRCEITLKFAVGKSLSGRNHYFDAIRLGQSLGVDRIHIKALRHEPEELGPVQKVTEAEELKRAIELLKVDPKYVTSWIVPEPISYKCWLNPLHTVMDYRGNIYICCFYYYREEAHLIGNIFEKDFEEIWMGPEHRKKIAGINPEECNKVDCKFFRHHDAFNQEIESGRAYFI